MTRCACQTGFFSLRECEQESLAQCIECGRAMCALHMASADPLRTCRDCYARRTQHVYMSAAPSVYDDDWVYGYRHRYYGSAGYAFSQRSYDSNDAQSFVAANDELEEDDPQAGFGDS
jgi:hypothetical protein